MPNVRPLSRAISRQSRPRLHQPQTQFVRRHIRPIYGRYPAAERWRADMAFALLAFVLLQVATARHKTAAAVLSALLPVAVYILLRGGVFGLPEVATQLWGGVMLTLVIA